MSTSSDEFSTGENADTNSQKMEGAEQLPPPFESPEILEEQTVEAPDATTLTGMENLPPEAQGEANGGPLGCCLGITVGILLSLTIAVVSRIYPDLFINIFGQQLSIFTRILMISVLVVGAIIFGTVGWRIGKRFYREYEPNQRYLRKMAELEERERKIARRQRQRRKAEQNASR